MKKALSMICAVCMLVCLIPAFAVSAATRPTGPMYLTFNSSDWTGDTAQIDTSNSRFYAKNGASSSIVTLTYKSNLDLSADDFEVRTYLCPILNTSNRYGEYCALIVGNLELREYNQTVDGTGVYTLRLFYGGTELASADLGSTPNHAYSIVAVDGMVRVMIDNTFIKLTDTDNRKVNGVSAASMSFSNVPVSIRLAGNYSKTRYAEGVVIDPSYDIKTTDDVNYPDSSLYIKDPADDSVAISYLNTPVTIPTGTANTLQQYNVPGIYFASDIWQAVPMLSRSLIDRGFIEGGEACQAIASVVCSSDGMLAFFGTDCGGLWRSLDGGVHWQLSTIGLDSAGATGIAIDPRNKDHVILVGCNTGKASSNGIYVTTDAYGQCEWTKTLSASAISGVSTAITIHNDYRIQIAYDTASYDPSLGYCKTAYWSVENVTGTYNSVDFDERAMWKTTDGGFTWRKLENCVSKIYLNNKAQADSKFLAGAEVASINYGGKTYIFAATESGFYVSSDGGAHWTETLSSKGVHANAVAVVNKYVNGYDSAYDRYVWVSTDSGMYRSTDCASTWSKVDGFYYPVANSNGAPDNIIVSSLNPDNIYITFRATNGAGWYSDDGGKSWYKSAQSKNEAWQPVSGISPFGYWSNIHANTVYVDANGIWKSIDGGANLHWSNSGYNAILVGDKYNFNVNNPNLVSVSSQDYNGGFSTDGGKTWTYLKWKGRGWGGYTYGSYMLDENTIIACDADSWSATRYLWVTHDAGKTYTNTGIAVSGTRTAIGCLGHDNIAFMGEWRTDDYGYTWTEMRYDAATGSAGCDGVFTVDYERGTLFGRKGSQIVYSTNNGVTWHRIGNMASAPSDMAYNYEQGILFVVSNGRLLKSHIDFDNPSNTFDIITYTNAYTGELASSCAIDPNNPDVLYVSDNPSITATSYEKSGLYRSLDAGNTWTCLTRQVGDGRDLCPAGGKAAGTIRVNPATGELFASTSCKGVWKIAAPAQWYLDANPMSGRLTADVPSQDSEELTEKELSDITNISQYANYNGYEPKTVTLQLVDANAAVENGYFKVPDGVTVNVGDSVKLGCSGTAAFTLPNGNVVNNACINTTTVRGNWSYSKQVCSNSANSFTFDEPGYYTIYNIISGASSNSGWAMVTFYVADPYSGFEYISNQQQLAGIADNLSGNYIITDDITLSGGWTPIGTESAPFSGVIYGNGHTVSGLDAPLFGYNNGAVSNLNLVGNINGSNIGMVATGNTSYIGYVSVGGAVTGNSNGGIVGYNAGIIKQCLVTATVSGQNCGGIAGYNHSYIESEATVYAGSFDGVCYPDAYDAVGSGQYSETDTVLAYDDVTDSALADVLDDHWYFSENGAPQVMVNVEYGLADLTDKLTDFTVVGDAAYIDTQSVTVSDLLGRYSLGNATLTVVDVDGNIKSGNAVITVGDKLTLDCYGTVTTVIFAKVGQITDDGVYTSTGLLTMRGALIDLIRVSDAVAKAADMDLDGSFTSADCLIYKQILLGLIAL